MQPKTIEDLDRLRNQCKSMVTTRAGLSAGVSVVPIPGLDLGADVALLIDLIASINRQFGLTPAQIDDLDIRSKKIILIAITSIGSEMVGKLITKPLIIQVLKRVGVQLATKSVVKYVPFLGSVIAASISFGAMKLVGDSHVDACYAVAQKALLAFDESAKA